jgi:hypothetical protein
LANKISTIIDFSTDQAKTGLAGFKNAVNDADGATGKFKAGFGSLKSSVGNFLSGPGGLLAAGGAIAAVGGAALDQVGKFSALGVEVGKLADSTGLSAEAASRWHEVAGDINIDSSTLETSIGKMNKTLGATPSLFKDAGIEIARTKDGVTDVNQTFLNAIDRLNGIKDPAEKAELAAKLFGKGWQSMSELIDQGSGRLKKSLGDVADVKVFDDAKIDKARAFRDATNALKDTMEELGLEVGQDLTPALTGLVGVLQEVVPWVRNAFGVVGDLVVEVGHLINKTLEYIGLPNPFETTTDGAVRATESFANLDTKADRLSRGIDVVAGSMRGAALDVRNTAYELDRFAESVAGVDQQYSELTGKLDEADAWENVIRKIDEAGNAAKLTGQDARDLTRDIADYVAKTETIPESKKTEILALLDQGKIAEAEAALANLTRQRDIYLALTGPGATTAAGYAPRGSGPNAGGGMGQPGDTVGEYGVEMLTQGANVRNPGETRDIMSRNGTGGGDTYVINPPVGFNDRDLMRALKKLQARNGPAFLSS